MTGEILGQAFVYLCAAVVCVPLSKRFGLGTVLGYLIAGVLIGPFVLGLVGGEGAEVMHFAEFGVVMMMFVVGLELRPQVLWGLRRSLFGFGGLQVLVTSALGAGLAFAFGQPVLPALGIGFVVAMSSTAIVGTSLTERGLAPTPGGSAAFAVLLFQDIAVIPILAVFPLLAAGTALPPSPDRPSASMVALASVLAVLTIVAVGRFVVRPVFQFLARLRLRESFVAFALLLVVGIAWLMHFVGLSAALGTFMAGVVLADSEYRHELEADLEPFKGLLLGLFFVSIGAQIDLALIVADPRFILVALVLVVVLKAAILFALARLFALDRPARFVVALALAQVGEFAFVLIALGVEHRVFDGDLAARMFTVVASSMALTPLFFVLLERVILPRLAGASPRREPDEIASPDAEVVIAGYGRFGQIVGRILRANRVRMTVLDLDPEMVDVLARLGIKVHYGDASRLDLLEAAGCARASLFVLAVDDAAQASAIAETVRRHYPDLRIVARARDRVHYVELRRLGLENVHRETFAAAYEAGIDALELLGCDRATAERLGRTWRTHEDGELAAMIELWDQGEEARFARARQGMNEAERLMREEGERQPPSQIAS